MTTAHCCAALQRAAKAFDSDTDLRDRINNSLSYGIGWLKSHQNEDGGWGTEPSSGGEGKESNVLAVFYAVIPFIEAGETADVPGVVREAARFLRGRRNGSDGSWSAQPSLPGDPCNTARAATTLIRTKSISVDDDITRRALRFILSKRDAKTGLWEVAEEPFFYFDAGGYISFHQNALCDVLILFSEIGYRGPEIGALIKWLLSSQDKNTGLWPLSSPNWHSKEIVTWSTGEWILALDIASRRLGDDALSSVHLSVDSVSLRRLRTLSLTLAVALALLMVGFERHNFASRLSKIYKYLPSWAKWIVATLVVGSVVSALSDGVKGGAKTAYRRISSRWS